DFKNAVVILTSNLGTRALSGEEGETEATREAVRDELKAHFRPEFLNRLDDIVIFRKLDRKDLARIVDIQLERLAKILAEKEVRLEVSARAKEALAEEGWDPQYGARPLKRVIQKRLQDEVAKRLIAGELQPGDAVAVDHEKGAFKYRKK
ncbi:MAG: AAA family ATPase, partial [Planctomycetes bacterium]|nr:AAA family ATPase [Planctomycetota bacterium]